MPTAEGGYGSGISTSDVARIINLLSTIAGNVGAYSSAGVGVNADELTTWYNQSRRGLPSSTKALATGNY